MRSLRELGVVPKMSGSGVLVRQTPPPGSVMKQGESVELVFEPRT
jgi:beta-lactam-binding protein with PASTA domain